MKDNFKYYIFNKPYKVLCQFSTEGKKITLKEYFPDDDEIYSVGRLDFDSEGLLILTNDNQLIHKLTAHENQHERTYLVQVEGNISKDALLLLTNGIDINLKNTLYRTKPCMVKKLNQAPEIPERYPPVRYRANIPTSFIEITLKEGKNRQVRKMLAKVGFPVLRLLRTSIGNLHLGSLKCGEYTKLSRKFIYDKIG
ncbi:MAG: pseudouridine synthase [Candidatus Kapabacteria bacterium]|nr:pseudouridine synthase [Ignavibacteriota bacterium]MCW5883369.1 pseudouridine synthase [Candidatus Kapabacteria bacterium]